MNKKNYNRFVRDEGNFNWLDLSQEQASYTFIFREDAPIENFSMTIPLRQDNLAAKDEFDMPALDLCDQLIELIESRYIYTSTPIARLREARAYLAQNYDQDLLDATRWKLAKLQEKAKAIQFKIESLREKEREMIERVLDNMLREYYD